MKLCFLCFFFKHVKASSSYFNVIYPIVCIIVYKLLIILLSLLTNKLY